MGHVKCDLYCCLHNPVDDLFKLYIAAGLWISLRRTQVRFSAIFCDSPKDVILCTFSSSSSRCVSPVANFNLEMESTEVNVMIGFQHDTEITQSPFKHFF